MIGISYVKSLFTYSGDDFEVWESKEHEMIYYNIGVEGYMGFDSLNSLIGEYESFLAAFEKFLTENNFVKKDFEGWKKIYSTRAIEVCCDHDCYWSFLDGYKSHDIWELHTYMKDVIGQLKTLENNLTQSL